MPQEAIVLLSLALAAGGQPEEPQSCERVHFGDERANNIACKCNSTHRDQLLFQWPTSESSVFRLTSNAAGLRFEKDHLSLSLSPNPGEDATATTTTMADYLIELHADRRAQQVTGFGGAFSDSSSELISMLKDGAKLNLLEDYFGASGLDYNMGRVPISGTDMSTRPYSYDDLPDGEEDLELKEFRLQEEDLLYKIPLIRSANLLRAKRNLEPLKLIAASWSAPGWMKSNSNLVQGRIIGSSTSGPYYMAYARYILKFLDEYEKRQVKMWALTPQNEPHTPSRLQFKINFNSVNFAPDEMVDYLSNCLIPSLIESNRTSSDLKLFIWDDTLDDLHLYQEAVLREPKIRDYMTGTAIHWYSQSKTGQYGNLYNIRQKVIPPSFSLISTEACFIGKPKPGNWYRGQTYARDIIENLRVGSLAWVDWNMALNMSGGPTWVGNILDAAILIEPANHVYYKNPMYYALGHVSRFIRPNSYVTSTTIFKRTQHLDGQSKDSNETRWTETSPNDLITCVAAELSEPFRFKSGTNNDEPILQRRFALVVLNRSPEVKRIKIKFHSCLAKENYQPLEMELSGQSITSLAFTC